MKERPILFSSPMVRAILAGTKTQTRRVLPTMETLGRVEYPGKRDRKGYSHVNWLDTAAGIAAAIAECRYGQPGDRLWVRETWMPDAPRNGEWNDTAFYGCGMSPLSDIPECYRKPWHCLYRATHDGCEMVGWKPSIHMPRWASRITLEVTGVRVERLQDISEADCQAEGIESYALNGRQPTDGNGSLHLPAGYYRYLWESINGPGSWEANPWVWVVEFRKEPTP